MRAGVRGLMIGVVGAVLGAVAVSPLIPAQADLGTDRADVVRFQLHANEETVNENVYCGVAEGGSYDLDVAVSNPPRDVGGGTGWLGIGLQEPSFLASPEFGIDRFEFSVPFNESFSFSLTLGGTPGVDQIVQIASPPLGDEFGGGVPFLGIASVQAPKKGVDPFDGDGRSDNYCVAIGGTPAEGEDLNADNPGTWPTRAGVEFVEGEISTSLPVPDWWVTDGDGSDGGVLVGPF